MTWLPHALPVLSGCLIKFINKNFIPLKIMDMILTTSKLSKEFTPHSKKLNPFATFIFALIICNAGSISMSILTSNQQIVQALFFNGSKNHILWSSFIIIWWFSSGLRLGIPKTGKFYGFLSRRLPESRKIPNPYPEFLTRYLNFVYFAVFS